MPTYEYECGGCGHHFEKFQPMTSNLVRTCPACGKRKLRRLIGMGGALIFKGSGFYATDHRSASYKADAKKDVPKTDAPKKDESPAPAKCCACEKGAECPRARKE
jgi:putative FmdB family regulatory protein